jgi:predicted nucleic acid-binding protein
VTLGRAQRFLDDLRGFADLVADAAQPWARATRDPKDDYLVALAQATHVDFLVSGDHDLTALAAALPPVLTPAAFLRRLGEEG